MKTEQEISIYDLISELQVIHDDSEPAFWEGRFADIARKKRLELP